MRSSIPARPMAGGLFLSILLSACGSEDKDPVDTGEPAHTGDTGQGDTGGDTSETHDTETGPDTGDTGEGPQDQDGDGILPPEDCDDTSPSVHPGADETCNSQDDDCDGETDEADAVDARDWYPDGDGDGWGDGSTSTRACEAPSGAVDVAGDCDDARATVSPGATEVCNRVDDDCDGVADEGDAADARTWYTDGDGDGYGDPATATGSCTVPSGMVADGTDCDDTRPRVNPSADEACDDLDNDCDGETDEADAVDADTWYLDGDGDGFGTSRFRVEACEAPSGFVAASTDCDDSDAAIFPGAAETWYDGVDQDCEGDDDNDADGDGFDAASMGGEDCDDTTEAVAPGRFEWVDGLDNDCDGTVDSTTGEGADAEIMGEAASSYLTFPTVASCDENGDGRADLLLPSINAGEGGSKVGAVYVFHGPLSGSLTTADADVTVSGSGSQYFGYGLASAADMDVDGYDDFVAGTYQDATVGTGSGAAWVFMGPLTASGTAPDLATATLYGDDAGDAAGMAVSSAGDVDADGFGDVMVGSVYDDGGATDGGAASLLLGPLRGIKMLDRSDAILQGTQGSSLFGASLTSAGDLDGDGYGDLGVGARGWDGTERDEGRFFVFHGPLTGTLDTSAATGVRTGEAAGDQAGYPAAGVGDVDDDGLDDLLIGAQNHGGGGSYRGAAYLVLGPATAEASLSTAGLKWVGSEDNDMAGASLSAGDVDGDRRPDLLVGAAYAGGLGTDRGAAYLFLGSTVESLSGTVDLAGADALFYGVSDSDLLGRSGVVTGDTNGDRRDEVLLGAYQRESGAGAAWLFLGGEP